MATRPASTAALRLITLSGVLAALAIVLALTVRFPLLAAAPFLLYEPSDVPLLIGAFRIRPGGVVIIAALVSLVLGLAGGGGIIGMVSRFVGSAALALTTCLLYGAISHRRGSKWISVAAGIAVYTAAEIVLTVALGPLFFGSFELALQFIVPVIIPFNLVKGTINGAAATIIESVLEIIFPSRDAELK